MTTKTFFSGNNLDSWLAHLEQLHPNAIDLGLTRITEVGQRLNLINYDAKVITVAGTNGKGTTCAFLEKILIDAGYKVGVYSSPHIHRYNERLRINFKELSDQRHCDAFSMIEKTRLETSTSLSYFEYATLACLYLLKQEKCDFILLEVGLGGRLDATNMVESDISVITTIGIDHVDWLGSDREKIGFEKAGVFRPNKPAICGELDVPHSIIEHANAISAKLKLANKDFSAINIDQAHWSWIGKQTLSPIKQTLMPIQNASTALAVIETLSLDIKAQQLINSIEQASLAGRLQPIEGYLCDVYIDVAHNPQSAEYLASQLRRIKVQKNLNCQVHAVVGMLSDKDMTSTLTAINHEISDYRFASLNCYRGANADLLFEAYKKSKNNTHNVVKFTNVESAFEDAINKRNASDIIIVFGSFHTVSDILIK